MSATPRPESVVHSRKSCSYTGSNTISTARCRIFVLQRRNANRACLARSRLLQVHPAYRRRSIPSGLEPLEQPRQVRLQLGLVLRRRHSVHTRRRVLAVRRQASRIHTESMWCASVVRVSFGSLRASSAILHCRVEMTSRPNVLAICPSASSIIRSAASLRRVLWGEFPDLTGPISRLRLLAPRRASLRFLRSALPPLRPLCSPGVGRFPVGLDHFYRGGPRRAITVEKTRYPRFLGDPCVHAPLFDPGGPPAPGHYRTGDVVFRTLNNVDSAFALSRLDHAACTLSVYASQPESPPDRATLDSGWWPALTGQDSHLLGRIDGLPSCLSVYMASSITKLRLAQSNTGFALGDKSETCALLKPPAGIRMPPGTPPAQPRSTSNPTTLRLSRLNSTPTR